jgi:hypothetical protein
MVTGQERTKRRWRFRIGAVLLLSVLGSSLGVGLGCELFTLDRAMLYNDAFDATAIDTTPKEDAQADAPPDAEPDAPSDADVEADVAVETGTDAGTDADAAGG